MYRFYAEPSMIQETNITISGTDVNHIKNVLRMKEGEKLIICDGQGNDFLCMIVKIAEHEVIATIQEQKTSEAELQSKIYLFQGLPKKDKMELIIQKAVELGAYEIIPVMMKRTIVKLEDKKKEQKKLERWQSIANAAAKQSQRGCVPRVHDIVTFQEAIVLAKVLDIAILPYECAKDISHTKEVIKQCVKKESIGVFIGPEGGFDEEEVKAAIEALIEPITLGKRILRTETAGLTILSVLMMELEEQGQ